MTMSKYCRQSGVNIVGVSKESGIPLKELNRVYNKNILLFEELVNKAGLLTFRQVAKLFDTTIKRVQVWRLRGLKAVRVNNKNMLYYPDICDFIATGRA